MDVHRCDGVLVQERFDPCIDAGIRGVTVKLQGKGGFGFHDVPEIGNEKGIGTAAEICDIHSEETGMGSDESGSLEDFLPGSPAGYIFRAFIFVGQEIERDHLITAAGKFLRDPHVRFPCKGVVCPPEYNNTDTVLILFQPGKGFPSLFFPPPEKILLLFQGNVVGLVGFGPSHAESPDKFRKNIFLRVPSSVKI